MDARLLRYFVAVADEGGIVGAAAALRLAQPSLSRAVRAPGRLHAVSQVRGGDH